MPTKEKRFLGQRGAALVEFAVIAPLLILITLGTIELGRYAYFAILVSNAAQAGAAYGSQNITTAEDTPGMEAAVVQDASPNPIATVTASPGAKLQWGCWDFSNAKLATPFPVSTNSTSGVATCPAAATQTPYPYVSVSASGTLKPLFHLPFVHTITIQRTVVRRVQCLLGGTDPCS